MQIGVRVQAKVRWHPTSERFPKRRNRPGSTVNDRFREHTTESHRNARQLMDGRQRNRSQFRDLVHNQVRANLVERPPVTSWAPLCRDCPPRRRSKESIRCRDVCVSTYSWSLTPSGWPTLPSTLPTGNNWSSFSAAFWPGMADRRAAHRLPLLRPLLDLCVGPVPIRGRVDSCRPTGGQ